MRKTRLITILMMLCSSLAIFCIGFASWNIIVFESAGTSNGHSGNFEAYDVTNFEITDIQEFDYFCEGDNVSAFANYPPTLSDNDGNITLEYGEPDFQSTYCYVTFIIKINDESLEAGEVYTLNIDLSLKNAEDGVENGSFFELVTLSSKVLSESGVTVALSESDSSHKLTSTVTVGELEDGKVPYFFLKLTFNKDASTVIEKECLEGYNFTLKLTLK